MDEAPAEEYLYDTTRVDWDSGSVSLTSRMQDHLLPSVDVVIPALNCQVVLNECLRRIRMQNYPGHIRLIVVDGGSTDGTRERALEWKAEVFVNQGQYASGLNGARRYGESLCSSELLWNLDADNWIVESDGLAKLVVPFIEDANIQLAIPFPHVENGSHSFNSWLALNEIAELRRLYLRGINQGAWTLVEDVDYGLTNATLVRRATVETVGGYDTDVGVLRRLRKAKKSRGGLVPTVHFVHKTADGLIDYARKWERRLGSIAARSYVEAEAAAHGDSSTFKMSAMALFRIPFNSAVNLFRSGNITWVWGLAYSAVPLWVSVLHPRLVAQVLHSMP